MNKNVFKSRVIEHLALRGLTVKDLAERIGISQGTIYNRFNCPEKMTFEEFHLIRKALGFSADAVEDILGSMSCLPPSGTRASKTR